MPPHAYNIALSLNNMGMIFSSMYVLYIFFYVDETYLCFDLDEKIPLVTENQLICLNKIFYIEDWTV